MNKFRILFLVFFSLFVLSCSAQKSKDVTLEGKWEVVNWTQISEGANLDEEEKQCMNESSENLIFDFKPNKIISTNKPEEFKDLEGEEFTVNINNSIMVEHELYDFFIRDDKCFFVFSNIIFQIKKIKDYQDSKIKLRRYQVDYGMSKKDYTKKYEEINDVYNIEDVDIPPKFKSVDFNDDCLIYCLYSAFKSNMIYYIDFAEIKEDISYFISFVIDKSGNVKNINIRSRHDKVIGKGRWLGEPIYNQEFDDVSDEFSEVEADIVKSILEFKDDLLPGIKDGENVNTELKLQLKLITK